MRPVPLLYRTRAHPAATLAYRDGLQASWEGDREHARELYQRSAECDPSYVAAQRALQNLALEDHRRGQMLIDFQELVERSPDDARLHYLLGRLQSHPQRQRRHFKRAQEVDPSLPWSYLGLGHVALGEGNLLAARELFASGLACQRNHRELLLGLIRVQLSLGELDEAQALLRHRRVFEKEDEDRLLLEAELELARDKPRTACSRLARALRAAPRNERFCRSLDAILSQHGTFEDAREILAVLRPVASVRTPALQRLLFHAADLAHENRLAVRWGETLSDPTPEDRVRLRQLRFELGHYQAALEGESRRFEALRELGLVDLDWSALSHLARELQSSLADETQVLRFTGQLARLGWNREALAVLKRVRVQGAAPTGPIGNSIDELVRLERFEESLAHEARECYRVFDETGQAPELEEFLERLAVHSRAIFGEDLFADARVLSFWPVGSLLDPDPVEGGALARYFADHGRLAVLGKRRGWPPEVLLLPALGAGRAGPQSAVFILAEGVRVPSYLQHRGALLSGAALDRFLYIDIAAIESDLSTFLTQRANLSSLERVLRDPALPVRDREGRLDLDEPGEVTAKLRLRALRHREWRGPGATSFGLLADAVDAVLAHELMHLEDADRFLPLGWKLLRRLPFLAFRLLRPERIEAWLEMRAQCAALVRARNPYWVLANCTGYLPERRAAMTPHAHGYRELVERMIEVIDRHPRAFAGLDRNANLLQQLDRLEADEIRWIARVVGEQLGLENLDESPVVQPGLDSALPPGRAH